MGHGDSDDDYDDGDNDSDVDTDSDADDDNDTDRQFARALHLGRAVGVDVTHEVDLAGALADD